MASLPADLFPSSVCHWNKCLQAYTQGAAYAQWAESQQGSLSVGKLADIAIWDRDLFQLPVEKVHTAKVVRTIFGGAEQ